MEEKSAASIVAGFPPIVSSKPRLLILGSMPGEASLRERQYYAHPRNLFWPILSDIFNAPMETYAQRRRIITANGLALWDVLAGCVRPGSLDSAIDFATATPNDFVDFFTRYPSISTVVFNGSKAEEIFRKKVLSTLADPQRQRLQLLRLPSTSPAMASQSFSGKRDKWSVALRVSG